MNQYSGLSVHPHSDLPPVYFETAKEFGYLNKFTDQRPRIIAMLIGIIAAPNHEVLLISNPFTHRYRIIIREMNPLARLSKPIKLELD